jgi:cell division septum initiation protein DivIVA
LKKASIVATAEAQKRSFNRQMTEIMSANKEELKKQGLDITAKLKLLQDKAAASEKAEEAQLTAMSEVKAKTAASVKMTTETYALASAQLDAIVGTLGKDHTLSQKLKKMRESMSKVASRGVKKAKTQ